MKRRQLATRLILSASLLFVTAAMSTDARAAASFVHANTCSLISGTGQPTIWGFQGNGTGVGAQVWCGVGRGADPVGLFGIRVFDRNPNADVSCHVWGLDNSGFYVWDSGVVHSSGSQTSAQWLPVPPGIPASVETFAVNCTIPGFYGGNNSLLSGFSLL